MRKILLVFGVCALFAGGCASRSSIPSGGLQQSPSQRGGPLVRQSGEVPVQWRTFAWGGRNTASLPSIVTGPDKNMWYTDLGDSTLIKMSMTGHTQSFPLGLGPEGLTVGSDGNFYTLDYFTATTVVGTVTPSGVVTTHAVSSGDDFSVAGLTLGPDGNVWFGEFAHIGKITPAGVITEYKYSDGYTSNSFASITAGPDGNVWATEESPGSVDKIVPSSGAMTNYALGCSPTSITTASDGNLWVNCGSDLARVTTSGVVTLFYLGTGAPNDTNTITKGPDGNPWFIPSSSTNNIAEFAPKTDTLTIYYPPSSYGADQTLFTGPDGNVWAVDSVGDTSVYIINVIGVSPASLKFTGTGQMQSVTVTEKGATSWTAVSNNTAVATVATTSNHSVFNVTSVGVGTTKIVISDAIGNSFAVHVNVQ
jgi:streptogramin lyase